ncbi:adventurous gliding motility protein T [Bdellovibrio bacteriovorus]|uniref:Adventurous gliding motility protein T n=1 Tax=Bdellovibrio bacteriovorus TaxID=959 RepID=A0A150WSL7_BDEBC|nr:tetratricopeptide repeat protein [Bdellovibrio bacteriovorus]KYG67378.1 adventurous gliding motility protein T [Bdellovibrio bacteriovorus]
MKKFIILSLLVLAGCSSSPVKDSSEEVDSAPAPEVSGEVREEKATPAKASKAEEPVRPATPMAPSQYAGLNDAIKSQSDEKIYQTATQILSQSPNDGRALNALAMYHFKKGRHDLSRYLLNKGIAANARMSELHSNMGIVQLSENERREAIKSFRKALEINNGDGIAAANLAAIYTQEKDYNKAGVVCETAYKRGVRDPRFLNNYAIVLTAQQKFDKAKDMYEAVLKEESNNSAALYNYATLLIDHMGKFQEGLEQINRLKFVGGPADTRNRIIALENKAKAGIK